MATKIAEKKFTACIVREGSWGVSQLGKHASSMTLYASDAPGRAYIEWEIPAIDEYVEIGLSFDVCRNLLDYDGVFSLPREAVALIRSAGFKVGRDFL